MWRSGSAADEILWVSIMGRSAWATSRHTPMPTRSPSTFTWVVGRCSSMREPILYHSPGGWRDRLRRTAEHNTVAVDADDSSTMAGPFNWRRGSRASGRLVRGLRRADATEWSVAAQHRGYVKRYGLVHRRVLEGMGRCSFRLIDQLKNGLRATVSFRWSLLVAPELDVVRTADGWVLSADGASC